MTRGRSDPLRAASFGSIFRNLGWMLGGRGTNALLSLIYLGIATRTLGINGFGRFSLVLGIAQAAVGLVNFSTWQIIVHFGMPHLRSGRMMPLRRLIGFGTVLDLGSAVVGSIIAVAGILLLGPYYGWDSQTSLQAVWFSVALLLANAGGTPTGVLRLHDRFAEAALADALIAIVRLILAAGAAAIGLGLGGFLAAWAFSALAGTIALWLAGLRTGMLPVFNLTGVTVDNPGLWRFSWMTNIGAAVNIASRQAVVLIVGLLAGPATAGGYRLANQLGTALAKVAQLLSRAMLPELVRARETAGTGEMRMLINRTTRMVSLSGIAILLLLWLTGEPLLGIVAGSAYIAAYPLLLIFAGAAVLDLAGSAFEPALLAMGKAGLAVVLRLVAAAILLALLPLFEHLLGDDGAAWAVLAGSAISLVLLGMATHRAALSSSRRAAPLMMEQQGDRSF